MQKIAASVLAAVALHGCDDGKSETPAIRGQPAAGVSASDLESLKNKAKKQAQKFVKTAHLNAMVTQGFQAMKKSGLNADQIATGTEDLKKYAVKAQHEILKGEKQLESVIPEYKEQVLKVLNENKAGDFIKQMENYSKTLNTKDMEQEAEHMLRDTHMFTEDQLLYFNNVLKSTIHTAQQSFGENPLGSKALNDLAQQMDSAKHNVVKKFEALPTKVAFKNALDYEKQLYEQLPYDKLSNGAKELKNNLTEANVNKELQKAQDKLNKILK